MQAKVDSVGDVTVVHFQGRIDYENIDPFRQVIIAHLKGKKVVFNLNGLSFVGSSGITPFIQTIVDFAETNPSGLKLCGVGSEFRKIFDANETRRIEIFEDQNIAENSFYEP